MAKTTFPRRFFLAVCLVSIAVMAYILFYHDPCLAERQRLKQDSETIGDQQIRSHLLKSDEEAERAAQLTEQNQELLARVQELRTALHFTTEEVVDSITRVKDRVGIPNACLSFDEPHPEMQELEKEGNVTFMVHGDPTRIVNFIMRLPEFKGTPRTWRLWRETNEFDEEELYLWMEVEP